MKCLKVFCITISCITTVALCCSCGNVKEETINVSESFMDETTREELSNEGTITQKETAIEQDATTKKEDVVNKDTANEETTTKKAETTTNKETATKNPETTTNKETETKNSETTTKKPASETTTKKTTSQTTTKKPASQTTTQKTTSSKTTSQSTSKNEETTTEQQTTGQPQKVTYKVTVYNKSNLPLDDIDVYVYSDSSHEELVIFGTTDLYGEVEFTLKKNNKYSIVLREVPKGYQVSSGYSFSGTCANITLSSSIIKEEINTSLKVGDIMYDITVTAPDGTKYTLSELLKKKDMVVLNFWFATCSWCIKEFPCIDEAYAQYKNYIEVLAVNPFDSMSDITYVKNTYGLTFPMVSCDYALATAFGITGYPTTVVIDKNGVIRMVEAGARTTVDYWEWLFEEYTD